MPAEEGEADDEGGQDERGKDALAADEVYCTECGEPIKEKAEICPECGVRQVVEQSNQANQANPGHQSELYELKQVARKDATTVMIVSFLITPVGYLMVNKTGLALVNFFTFNYFLFGPIIVPFHTRSIIRDAREELDRRGETW